MIEVREVHSNELQMAIDLEELVFNQENYPYDYHRFNNQSVVFGAFNTDGECVGVLRLIAQSPLTPPVLNDCVVWEPDKWIGMENRFEELGTQAVKETYRNQGIGLLLLRLAYQNAKKRGIEALGFIDEPERAIYMNNKMHFSSRQIGEIGFHGWDCAPFVHVLDEVEQKLSKYSPEILAWFNQDLSE